MDQLLHRKAKCSLRIVNEDGTPLKNVKAVVRQINHEFLFGCGAFDSLPLTNNADNIDFYKERVNKWLEIYNYGTLPFYLAGYEPVEGSTEINSRMNAAKFLKAHNVRLKGHPLCWHTACPDWLMQYDNKTILDKVLKRIERDVSEFAGVIDMWDVINEVVIMPIFDKYDNAITRICKQYGRVKLVKEVFAAAKAANPDAVLLINDFNLSTSYEILIDGCLEAGVPISAIGLQTHQHQGYMGAEKLEQILKRYEHFGLPLHFTENTLISGHLMPPEIVDLNDYQIPEWPTTPEGEERQKKEMEEMYRILFAHPLVEAITGWDFADGAWLGAPSGVIRKDNSVKPSYEMLKDLIHKQWKTEYETASDENGVLIVQGFKGEYEIEINGKIIPFTLKQNKEELCENVLRLKYN
jgi:GH35 family endo-1,4-beta-xylanase